MRMASICNNKYTHRAAVRLLTLPDNLTQYRQPSLSTALQNHDPKDKRRIDPKREERRRRLQDFHRWVKPQRKSRRAALIVKKGNPRPTKIIKVYIGSSTEHNSYEAEVVGGILDLWLIAIRLKSRRHSYISTSASLVQCSTVQSWKTRYPASFARMSVAAAITSITLRSRIGWTIVE